MNTVSWNLCFNVSYPSLLCFSQKFSILLQYYERYKPFLPNSLISFFSYRIMQHQSLIKIVLFETNRDTYLMIRLKVIC